MIRRPPRSTLDRSSAASDVYKRQDLTKSVSDRPIAFSFLNTEGNTVSIGDQKYNNKIKIIQIMGTWCPNCMDETVFLQEYFMKNPSEDVAVITIGFERYKDQSKSMAALKKFKDKMKISHEVLYLSLIHISEPTRPY